MERSIIITIFLVILVIAGATAVFIFLKDFRKTDDNISGIVVDADIKEFDIKLKDGKFTPDVVYANLGDTIKIRIKSIGHSSGFVMPDFSIDEELKKGKEKEILFVIDKKGSFTFSCGWYCSEDDENEEGKIII